MAENGPEEARLRSVEERTVWAGFAAHVLGAIMEPDREGSESLKYAVVVAANAADKMMVEYRKRLTVVRGKVSNVSFASRVRNAVLLQPSEFNVPQVKIAIDEMAPGAVDVMRDRNALSKALNRMAEKREIRLVRKGRGKRSAVYSREVCDE